MPDILLYVGGALIVWNLFLKDKFPGLLNSVKSTVNKGLQTFNKPATKEKEIVYVTTETVKENINVEPDTAVVVHGWLGGRNIAKKANLTEAVKHYDDMFPTLNAEKGE